MKSHVIESLIIAASIVLLGTLFRSAIVYASDKDRSVTVRGLAEIEVSANNAVWHLRFHELGDNLPALYATARKKDSIVLQFLKDGGFEEAEVTRSAPVITDMETDAFSENRPKFRYNLTSELTLVSKKVDLVRKAHVEQEKLINGGIALESVYDGSVQYTYTDLNEIKPKMIEDATRNAREAAEKFAKDSDSKLGKIRFASQGQFSIDDRDDSTPYIKRIRVVTSVQYSLED